jgi:hypothetical protein
MEKKYLFIIMIIVVASGILATVVLGWDYIFGKPPVSSSQPDNGDVVYVQLSKDNFAQVYKSQPLIQNLPENALILLKFYNFDSGARQWDASFLLSKGDIEIAPESINPDFTIIMHSKYIPYLGDFCGTVKAAKANNDFAVETNIPTSTLMWKYKSMLSYKDCFGL